MKFSNSIAVFAAGLLALSFTTGTGATETMKEWENSLRNKIVSQNSYPRPALKTGVEGTVKLRLKFANDGNIEGVEIVERSGHKLLDQNALRLALRLKDLPALPADKDSLSLVIPMTFRIKDES